eukprot:IDg23116t1
MRCRIVNFIPYNPAFDPSSQIAPAPRTAAFCVIFKVVGAGAVPDGSTATATLARAAATTQLARSAPNTLKRTPGVGHMIRNCVRTPPSARSRRFHRSKERRKRVFGRQS